MRRPSGVTIRPVSAASSSSQPAPRRALTLFDSVCIIVGIILGAGFYQSSPEIAAKAGSVGMLLALWIGGGMLSLIGALCYAELCTAYPREGGEYDFLSRAYHPGVGFLFAWTGFWIVRPGNIGAMAFVFASYAQRILPLPLATGWSLLAYAAGSVVVLSSVHILGVRTGKWTQNVLTTVKVVGVLVVFAVAFIATHPAQPDRTPTTPSDAMPASQPATGPSSQPTMPSATPVEAPAVNWQLAAIFVLFAYGGWNEISYVAAEVRDPSRNLFRALLLGTGTITAIYVVGNVAFLSALGFDGLAKSDAVAADVVAPVFSEWGGRLVSGLVCVSALGAISGMIFTGSRIFYAVGTDYRPLSLLGRWGRTLEAPVPSLLLQGAVTLGLIWAFGGSRDGFERLVVFTGPLFWGFLALTGAALFVLRRRDPHRPRPHRVIGYPVTPILFILASGFLVYAGVEYAIHNGEKGALWWMIGIATSGAIVAAIATRRARATAAAE